MTRYAKAWLTSALMLFLLVMIGALSSLLEPVVGSSASPLSLMIWLVVGVWLQHRVRCPRCGTSPYILGHSLAWAKPWPSACCAQCGYNLRAD